MTITLELAGIFSKPVTAVKRTADVRFEKSVTIDRPISDVYSFWRDLENLPSFMQHLESVTLLEAPTTYWVMRSSGNHLWSWTVELTEDRVDEVIAWRSFPDADIHNVGSARFAVAPGGRGTVVTFTQAYTPPVEPFVASIARVFAKDSQRTMEGDLARLKTVMERSMAPSVADWARVRTMPAYPGLVCAGQI